jgi:hypothetical protein
MDWNKDHIRETMLLLETAALHSVAKTTWTMSLPLGSIGANRSKTTN